ncbi:DUF6932 family protein [Mesorhizobium sp. B1-1-8]|uniref:DUF6932 family protein n=1 Tax=Mesorhizobium sp. B1-1-8 TaxID=2589976 RepID=UPI00112B65D1|nr:hypothetical protein [Mesorhizobium sp. B1-1-8]UCI06303.1 hypothetical protein FJ974_21145 [Mesorhizobium sp. B1-1-8]
MAAGRKPDFPPLLAPGAHYLDILAIRALAVDRFSGQDRSYRELLFHQLEEFVQWLLRAKIPGDLAVDGSFLTEKSRPSDVDVLFTFDLDVSEKLDAEQEVYITEINSTKVLEKIDSFAAVRYPRHHRFYRTPIDVASMSDHYGIENGEEWLKGYVVLRLWETDVGRRIRS